VALDDVTTLSSVDRSTQGALAALAKINVEALLNRVFLLVQGRD
jgi:hypothetical protein